MESPTTITVGCTQLLLAAVGFVYLVHIVHGCWVAVSVNSRPSYTLYLRKLKISGADMLDGNETDNIFLEEYNLLTDLLFPKLDVCVMKMLDGDLPVLSKQERLHAKMHNEGKAERKKRNQAMDRWGWYIFLGDLFLLRLGREIGCACAGYAEATSGVWFYMPMVLPFTKGFMSHEYAYHALEELEHGPLTTQYLRTQVATLSPLLVFPVMFIVYLVYFLFPPVMVLIMNPLLLLTRPKTIVDFVLYYCTFVPTFVATIYASIVYWVLPFRQSDNSHEERYQFFAQVVKERGIEFDILEQKTYMIDGTTAKVVEGIAK